MNILIYPLYRSFMLEQYYFFIHTHYYPY